MVGKIFRGVFAAALALVLVALPVAANTNYNLRICTQNEDRLWNYDFTTPGNIGRADGVDQPATIVYGGNANKTKVKNAYYYGFPWTGSTMYNQLDDGIGWVNNNDGGMKSDQSDLNGWHYRVYAAGGSNMQNSTWNKYVVVTTHRDQWPRYGWTVHEDILWFQNRDWPGRWEGVTQFWQCDGWASRITVP